MNKTTLQKYLMVAMASLLALLPFLGRLFYYSFSIDTEQMINTPQRILTSWLYHERPGLVWSKYLFGQTAFHYEIAVVGTVMWLMLACGVFVWIVYHPTGKKGQTTAAARKTSGLWWAWLFPIVLLSHPVMAEQFHFLLQSMEVAWALLLCLTAAGLSAVGMWNRRMIWNVLAVISMVWCFSSYQALVALYIAAAAGIYLLQYDRMSIEKETDRGFWWSLALRQVLLFGIGFLLSRGAAKVGLYVSTGSFEPTAYVGGMVKWGTQPAVQCLKDLYHHGQRIITGEGIFYTLAYVTALIGTLVMVLRRMRREWRRPGYVAHLLAGGILYLSPFLLPLYTGGPDQVRAQLALPFVIAFGWCYLIGLLRRGQGDGCAKRDRAGRLAILAACLFACMQYTQTARLSYTAYQTYAQECVLTEEITAAIRATGAPENAPVQLVGRWSPAMGRGMTQGETIGYSFYEWDGEKAYGSTERIVGSWNALGYGYAVIDLASAPAGCERAAKMPCWPEDGSVVWDGNMVVVKLSD